jgi:outer membrane lipoprotein SlyB
MRHVLKVTAIIAVILFGVGCANRDIETVNPEATQYVMRYETGTIESIRPVIIKDNGTGAFLGTITGGVLGSLVGEGKGNTLATLAGGLTGMYVGSQAGAANAQELTVRLDNGRRVVVIAKGTRFYAGERIRIVLHDGRISSVEPF